MRKMFSQNQIKQIIQNAINNGGITLPEELPSVEEATQGQILALNSDKEPVWEDVPQELPDQTGASEGDVLKIGSDGLEWGSAGGGGTQLYKHSITGIGGSPAYLLTLFTNDSTPITANTLSNQLKNSISSFWGNVSNQRISNVVIISFNAPNYDIKYYDFSSNTLTTGTSFSLSDTITDSVSTL